MQQIEKRCKYISKGKTTKNKLLIVSFCEINKLDPNIPRVRSKLDSDRNRFNKVIEKKTCIRISSIDISVLAALFFSVLKTAVGVFLQASLLYMIEQTKNCVES